MSSIEVSAENATYQSIDGNVYGKDGKTFIMVASAKQNVTVADGVTDIGAQAFVGCGDLKYVTLPESVAVIGEKAFYNCTCLESLTFEGTQAQWEKVDKKADWNTHCHERFAVYCTGIDEDLTPSEGLVYKLSDDGQSYIVSGIGTCTDDHVVIPNTYNDLLVTGIAERAFWNCKAITVLTIGKNVTSIGNMAFKLCVNLASVTIPENVTSIDNYAFYQCSNLKNITIENGVIGAYMFSECTSLTSVTIPSSVTNFGKGAFLGCTALANVTIAEGVKSIGNRAFENCTNLTSITFPSSITSIGKEAFYGSGLTSIDISDSVTSIGDNVFAACNKLTSINVSTNNEKYKTIDGNLYNKDGTALIQYAVGKTETSFAIPDDVTSIGYGAFRGCTALTSVDIHDGVTSIGDYAFQGCTNLTSIKLPSTMNRLFGYAFKDCGNLTSITFKGTTANWENIWKSSGWNSGSVITKVICTDGEISIE